MLLVPRGRGGRPSVGWRLGFLLGPGHPLLLLFLFSFLTRYSCSVSSSISSSYFTSITYCMYVCYSVPYSNILCNIGNSLRTRRVLSISQFVSHATTNGRDRQHYSTINGTIITEREVRQDQISPWLVYLTHSDHTLRTIYICYEYRNNNETSHEEKMQEVGRYTTTSSMISRIYCWVRTYVCVPGVAVDSLDIILIVLRLLQLPCSNCCRCNWDDIITIFNIYSSRKKWVYTWFIYKTNCSSHV